MISTQRKAGPSYGEGLLPDDTWVQLCLRSYVRLFSYLNPLLLKLDLIGFLSLATKNLDSHIITTFSR